MKQLCIFTVLLLSFGTTAIGYGQTKTKIKLLYTSADLHQPATDNLDIKRVHSAFFSDSLIVTLKNKKKLILPDDKIWGFVDNDSTMYRCFEGDFYVVRQIDTLIVYSRHYGKYNHYYFSKGGDGKVLSMGDENFKKEFAENPCFLSKIDTGYKWYQDYSSYNDKTKSYRILEFFKACLNDAEDKTKKQSSGGNL